MFDWQTYLKKAEKQIYSKKIHLERYTIPRDIQSFNYYVSCKLKVKSIIKLIFVKVFMLIFNCVLNPTKRRNYCHVSFKNASLKLITHFTTLLITNEVLKKWKTDFEIVFIFTLFPCYFSPDTFIKIGELTLRLLKIETELKKDWHLQISKLRTFGKGFKFSSKRRKYTFCLNKLHRERQLLEF